MTRFRIVLIRTLLFSFAVAVLPPFAAFAWTPSQVTVKVTAYFDRNDEELKLEGSGLLLVHEGQVVVLTSEHVVIPDKEKAVHYIQYADSEKLEAEFLRADWSKGLALLKVKVPSDPSSAFRFRDLPGSDFVRGQGVPDELTVQPWNPKPKVSAFKLLAAYGYPAGLEKLKVSQTQVQMTVLPAGRILSDQRVLAAEGLKSEFGMSGGPVFGENAYSLIGILTHVNLKTGETFIIPATDAYFNFIESRSSPTYARTYSDVQVQNFAAKPTEIVRHKSSGTVIEKRGADFLITIPENFPPANGLGPSPGFMALHEEMQKKRVRVAKVLGGLSEKTSLQHFVHYLNTATSIRWEDFEDAADSATDSGRSFHPRVGQSLKYELSSTEWSYANEEDLGQIRVVRKPTVLKGWKSVEVSSPTSNYRWDYLSSWRYDRDLNSHQKRVEVERLWSMDDWRSLRLKCENNGGKLEEITVPAGRFQTCRLRRGAYEYWYGPVPITGIVKIKSTDPLFVHEETLSEVGY